jgi:hypothetical protein
MVLNFLLHFAIEDENVEVFFLLDGDGDEDGGDGGGDGSGDGGGYSGRGEGGGGDGGALSWAESVSAPRVCTSGR